MKKTIILLASLIAAGGLLLPSCGKKAPPTVSTVGLKIVASTSIIGDVVNQVSGGLTDLDILIPNDSDPHTFEPRPQDIAALSDADLVFINGLHLEETLEQVLQANVKGQVIVVSDGIDVISINSDSDIHDETVSEEDALHPGTEDPHTWMDPNNVIVWTENIRDALSQTDPQNASIYNKNAEAYITQLRDLDGWIHDQVSQIPPEQRKLVTDHATFGYFADEYDFEQVGLVIPALSTNAAPSAQELSSLERNIQANGVKAIFVGKAVNPALSDQVAVDTGTPIVFVYTGSLSGPGTEADSYLKFMHYNVDAIVNALK